MRTFLLGAVVGAAAMWMWGDQLRARFAGQVDHVVDRVLSALDTVDDQLAGMRRRVESFATHSEQLRARDTA